MAVFPALAGINGPVCGRETHSLIGISKANGSESNQPKSSFPYNVFYRFLLASSHLRMHFCLYRWVYRPLVISQYNRWNKCAEIPEAYLTAIRQDRADEQAAGEYNYDEQGDDWTGTCQSGENQSPIDLIFEDVSFRRVIYFKVLLTFYLNSRKLWPFPVCVSTTMISHCKPPWWLPIMGTQVGSYQIT